MSKRVRVIGWMLIAGLPVLVLLGAEACARIWPLGTPEGRRAEIPAWLDRNILVKDNQWMKLLDRVPGDLRKYYATYAWDRRLFYRMRPNVTVHLTDVMAPPGIRERTRWTLRTNAKGFPGEEVPYGAHPGTFRIVCMGDSSTFGWGVESDEAYPAVLERTLRARFPGRSIQVVNLGVCGYSSFQGLVLMRLEMPKYRPDVVTISYGSNDWSRVPEPFDEAYARNMGWTGSLRALLHHSRAYEVLADRLSGLAASWREAGDARGAEMPWNVGPEKSRENLIEMVKEVRDTGAFPYLVTNCVPGEMAEPNRDAARETGAPLLDTAALLHAAIPELASGDRLPRLHARTLARYGESLVAEHPDLEVYLADRCHPNAEGQRILGEALASRLADRVAAAPGGNGRGG